MVAKVTYLDTVEVQTEAKIGVEVVNRHLIPTTPNAKQITISHFINEFCRGGILFNKEGSAFFIPMHRVLRIDFEGEL